MAEGKEAAGVVPVFEGLSAGEAPPRMALYQLGTDGRPAKKLLSIGEDAVRPPDVSKIAAAALGPDVAEPGSLTRESLVAYSGDALARLWREGLVIPRDIWTRFLFRWVCVSGRARKCRPWYWDILDRIQTFLPLATSGLIGARRSMSLDPMQHLLFPSRCAPLCDGLVEIYERTCCCRTIWVPCLLDRLREILEIVPIPLPPWPPEPPGPGPDPILERKLAAPVRAMSKRDTRRVLERATPTGLDRADFPPERLYDDYMRLSDMDLASAERYVLERPYLVCIACRCTTRKVGETFLQQGGRFDLCFRRPIRFTIPEVRCRSSYAVKIKQLIGGVWTTVYDGVAGNDWFSEGETIDARSMVPWAVVCGSDPGEPPPGEAMPFVMLERVGSAHHFNFPVQTAPSNLASLGPTSGLVDTGFASNCPWAGSMGLGLYVTPDLDGTAVYYRISTVQIDNAGNPTGPPTPLPGGVSWEYFEQVGANWVKLSKSLDAPPASVGGKIGLHRIPYLRHSVADADPNREFWLSDQYHGVWRTSGGSVPVPDHKYMVIVEAFDGAGNQLKPNSAPGPQPGTPAAFQFRRWDSAATTANVPHADVSHAFWVNNTPVTADLVDLRKNHVASTASCQFIKGEPSDVFSVGFKAYHSDTPSHPAFSFLYQWNIWWERGLNPPPGASGWLDSGVTEQGGPALVAESASLTFGSMLGSEPACSFSLRLRAEGKHFDGNQRLYTYDYQEFAAFALTTEACACTT